MPFLSGGLPPADAEGIFPEPFLPRPERSPAPGYLLREPRSFRCLHKGRRPPGHGSSEAEARLHGKGLLPADPEVASLRDAPKARAPSISAPPLPSGGRLAPTGGRSLGTFHWRWPIPGLLRIRPGP